MGTVRPQDPQGQTPPTRPSPPEEALSPALSPDSPTFPASRHQRHLPRTRGSSAKQTHVALARGRGGVRNPAMEVLLS